jgi:FHA domain
MLDLDAEHHNNSSSSPAATPVAGPNHADNIDQTVIELNADELSFAPPNAAQSRAVAVGLADDELLTIEQVLPSGAAVTARPNQASSNETAYYIQIIHQSDRAFLRTNLPHTETARTSAVGMAWLMGRSRSCTIVFPDPAVSRCHAVIGHDAVQGFYIMDVGSSNGTFWNQKRLVTMQRQTIQNGDVLTISHIRIEVFLVVDEG